ncbi:MAG: hypothetical protein Aurels2KO_46460 [Aureliella sp.]
MHNESDQPQSQDSGAACFAELASGIYRRFSSETVASGLLYAIDSELFAKNPTIMLMFVRIAEYYPESAELLRNIRDDAKGAQRQALDVVLDPPDEIRGAKYLPDDIGSPGEMDLCWAEFLVTGETAAIEKVIAVLDRDDLTRGHLSSRLAEQPPTIELSDTDLAALQKYGIGLGISPSTEKWEVMTEGDSDLFLWLGAKDNDPSCIRLMQEMDELLKLHLANKGAALMSLINNATQHGKIRLLCEQAATSPGGFGRTLLNPDR